MANNNHIPLKPIPIKDRAPMVFLQYGQLDVIDQAFVLVDAQGTRVQIPVAGLACIILEPGTRVSHAAIRLAAQVGCLLIWAGEAGVRLYSAGQPGGARADKLLWQTASALDDAARLKIVKHMFLLRFNEHAPAKRSVDQLRGIEGARVKATYKLLAQQYGVKWQRRNYNPDEWDSADIPNKCVSAATSCLYGITEAAILAAGYAPAIGFLHRGKPLSFVYDIADIVKFETVVPAAFACAAKIEKGKSRGIPPERLVRQACRDAFRETKLLRRIIPLIEDVLKAGEMQKPDDAPEAVPTAIPLKKGTGNDGHRH